MTLNREQLISLGAFRNRVQGLLNSGYKYMFRVEEPGMFFYKLVHRNGNRISLTFYTTSGILSQYTNGKQTFYGKMC